MKKFLFVAIIAMSGSVLANGVDTNPNSGNLPSDPQKGECYLHEWTPPTFEDGSTTVITKDGFTSYNVVPVQSEVIEKTVQISDPYAKFVVTGPVFEDRVEIVNLVEGNAWSLGKCGDAGEVACYNTVTDLQEVEVQRLVSDSSAVTEHIEAKTMTYNYTQITDPGSITELIADPITKEITTRVVTNPGEMAWVLNGCAGIGIKAVQQALADNGYDVGPIDGVVGVKTKAAIIKYKEDNNLVVNDDINDELNTALGLK